MSIHNLQAGTEPSGASTFARGEGVAVVAVVALAIRRWKCAAIASGALLLTACAELPSLPFGDDAAKAEAAARYASTGPADPRHTRMTKHDILQEWGTVRLDRVTHWHGKPRLSPVDDLIDDAAEAPTIKEIMANATCHSCDEKPYHEIVARASARHGVPTSLIHAVIQKESGYNAKATSRRHARGLMQVTPATARFFGVGKRRNLYDPQTNIDIGTAYLKYLLVNYATVDEALAAYNSGPGNVRKYKGVPPFRETKRYIRDVKRLYAVTAQ